MQNFIQELSGTAHPMHHDKNPLTIESTITQTQSAVLANLPLPTCFLLKQAKSMDPLHDGLLHDTVDDWPGKIEEEQ